MDTLVKDEQDHPAAPIADTTKGHYPGIGQSWGIVGIAILTTIAFIPLNVLLDRIASKDLSQFVCYVTAMGATFWIAHRKREKTRPAPYSFDKSSLKIMTLVLIMTIALQTGITSPILNLMPVPEFMQKVFNELGKRTGIFGFLTIAIAAPVLEELIFRGIILDGLLKTYSPLKSIVFSSVLFGIVHLNPWQFVSAFIIGLFSGWVYYKTKKLTLSIMIHAVNNLFAFAGMYLMNSETLVNQPLSETYGGLANFVLITVGIIAVGMICLYHLSSELKGPAVKRDPEVELAKE